MEREEPRKTRAMRLVELQNGDRPLQELLPEWLEQMTTQEIADRCGVHVTLVYGWMRDLQSPSRSKMPRNYAGAGSQ